MLFLSFIEWIILSSGWRRALVAALAGACGALALAPFDMFPAISVPLCVAIWLLDGAAQGSGSFSLSTLRNAAVIGWFWGFGYFIAGLWWLGAAFLVEADKFAVLLPLGVIGLPAMLAFFPAFGFVLARLLWSSGIGRLFALAFGLGLSELLRGWLFTGFPWNEPGMALGDTLIFAQIASVVGLYGLNIIVIVIFGAPALLISPHTQRFVVMTTGAGLLALAVFGMVRLSLYPTEWVEGVQLRLVQPNVPLNDDFRAVNKMAITQHYISLSDRATSPQSAGVADVTHLFWPESPFPTILSRDAEVLSRIGHFLPAKTTLLTGAVRMNEQETDVRPHYLNTLHVIASGGAIISTYDKVHLVPFGEYLPFETLLRTLGLRQFVQMPGGFDAGTSRRLLQVPHLPPVAPVICYEAIFPGDIHAPDERPGLILNLSNDGWFGTTPGPYQHLAQARLRSIEEGVPLIRDTNTGLSAVIDPLGRIIAILPLNVEDILDSRLPKAISRTLYLLWGHYILAGLFCCAGMAAVLLRNPLLFADK